MKINILKSIAILTILSAIFIPFLGLFGVFHISLFFLCILFILLTIHKRLRMIHYIVLLIIIVWPIGGSIVAKLVYNLPLEINALRSFAPLFILFLAYFCFNVVDFSFKEIYKLIMLILTFVSLMIIIQLVYPGSSLLSIYIPDNRVDVLRRYAMIMAPIGNPNNMALFISLLVLSCYQLLRSQSVNVSSKLYIYLHNVILIFGIIFSYARTVLVGFILSGLFLLLQNSKGPKQIIKITASLVIILLTLNMIIDGSDINIRQITYYKTILNPFEDYSFTSRFDFWLTSFNILINNPLLLITGLGWFRGALMQLQGHTTIDSSYVYILLSHGFIFTSIFFASIIHFMRQHPNILPIFIVLLVSAINLAYVTDYRLNIIIAFFISLNIKLQPGRSC